MKDVALGLVAGAVGALLWAGLVYFSGYEIGWLAWGVGALVGAAVAFGNKDRSRSPTAAGVLAVAITVVALAAGKYLAVTMMIPGDAEIIAAWTEQFDNEEFVMSYVADAVVAEFESEGRPVAWPVGVDPDWAEGEADYPSDVWGEARSRWEALDPAEQRDFTEGRREDFRQGVTENMDAIREGITADAFAGIFGPMDLIFFGLAIVTAWGLASGKRSKDEVAVGYEAALRLAMLQVMLADGAIDDEEVATIQGVYQQITGNELTVSDIRAQADAVPLGGNDLAAELAALSPYLNDNGKELVVKAALMVAIADGAIDDAEQRVINGVVAALGLTETQFQDIVAQLSATTS